MTDHTKSQNDVKPALKEQLPHSEYYYDPDGNLEIVSSDGVLLQSAAYRLQASSAIFAAMIKWGENGRCDRITLHDKELETASVLHGLLDVMVINENILDLCIKSPHSSTRRQLVIRLAQTLSPEMIWMLLRVSRNLSLSRDTLQADHGVMAENFTRLMALKGAPKSA